MNGPELLRQYREHGSENAFSELVRRFGDLVYSVAKRRALASGASGTAGAWSLLTRLILMSAKTKIITGTPLTLSDMYPGAGEDVIATLRAPEKRSFRFTIADRLAEYLRIHPEQGEAFRAALAPMLNDPKPGQRSLAAYALASWPGDKPEEVKRELLRELNDASPYSHHAAQALGGLGDAASDAVPALLKTPVTRENYTKLSSALREIDPAFEAEWRKTVAINYPWLDRTLATK